MKKILLVLFLSPLFAYAQIITTIAGCGIGDDSVATKAELVLPNDVALDDSGNMYIADEGNHRVRKISAAGIITTIAGNGIMGYSGDGGPATMAELFSPEGVTVDRHGNVYISDRNNYRVRKVDAAGIITTIAGTGIDAHTGDGGPASAATLKPYGIITDTAGNIYVSDSTNIRMINTSGIITTIAGNGTRGYSGDGGPATAAQFHNPYKMALDRNGNLYIADEDNYVVRKVDAGGTITTIAGNNVYGFSGDGGPATAAELGLAFGITTDTAGNVFVPDFNFQRIREINTTTGIINTIAGSGIAGYGGDGGPALAAELSGPMGILCDGQGSLYIADEYNNRVRKVNLADSTIITVAGQNGLFGEGYNAINAEMTVPDNVAVDAAGNVYIPDLNNNRVRKISTSGIITTVAGNGKYGYGGDGGPADLAYIYYPTAVAVDVAGNIFISGNNSSIRKVDAVTGIITTIAGSSTIGYTGDGGMATAAELNFPSGVAVDALGNVYVADNDNYRIRKINPSGIITTVAGNGLAGYTGDGIAATAGSLRPLDVAVDLVGNIYIADGDNYRIRKVDTAGIITTIAGTGVAGYSGDGSLGTLAEINSTGGVKADNAGNVYFSDSGNHIRMVDTAGIITTIAGTGIAGFTGDGGMATAAEIDGPAGVAIDASGNIYIADGYNSRVRKITSPYLSVPTVNTIATGGIVVYPNPASTSLTILSGGQPVHSLTIFNLLGQVVYSNEYNATQVQVDILALPAGVYFVKVNGVEVRKFVKG